MLKINSLKRKVPKIIKKVPKIMALKYSNSFKVSIPDNLYEKYRKNKNLTGMNIQKMVRKALEEYLDRENERRENI
jgi:hypothetical protein